MEVVVELSTDFDLMMLFRGEQIFHVKYETDEGSFVCSIPLHGRDDLGWFCTMSEGTRRFDTRETAAVFLASLAVKQFEGTLSRMKTAYLNFVDSLDISQETRN